MKKNIRIAFGGTALNESENIEELYLRCQATAKRLKEKYKNWYDIDYRFVIVDNGSSDNTSEVLNRLKQSDNRVIAARNKQTYEPDVSMRVVLELVQDFEFSALMCTDLQDPPELVEEMFDISESDSGIDSVMGVKINTREARRLKAARRAYYRLLGYSTRKRNVPFGFHGFLLAKRNVVRKAINIYDTTEASVRQCWFDASQSPQAFEYIYGERKRGSSAYKDFGYIREAIRTILSGDATTSRVAWLMAGVGVGLSCTGSIFILTNYLGGGSQYSAGTPTIMFLQIISFTIQMMVIALLSVQVEGIRSTTVRDKAVFEELIGRSDEDQS